MFHDRHELDGVVAQVFHVGKHCVLELAVRADARVFRGHAHVRLVDQQGVGPRWALVLPLILLGRVPEYAIVSDLILGLVDPLDPSRDPVRHMAIRRLHENLDLRVVGNGGQSIHMRKENGPNTKIIPRHLMAGPVPFVEVSKKPAIASTWSPLPVHDALVSDIESKLLVSLSKLQQATLLLNDFLFFLVDTFQPPLEMPIPISEPGIILHNLNSVIFTHFVGDCSGGLCTRLWLRDGT
mmetsp:Transcript_6155/g.15612  ORF Transcript_6155/g.15612 Transcript_6155/m.15612 type:complete len:239 (+) Transcript_6155:2828-3544(+)